MFALYVAGECTKELCKVDKKRRFSAKAYTKEIQRRKHKSTTVIHNSTVWCNISVVLSSVAVGFKLSGGYCRSELVDWREAVSSSGVSGSDLGFRG